MKHKIKVVIDISVDLDNMSFPTDDKGVLMWTPEQCIEDYISHGLFKEHDASYMTTLQEGIDFEGWRVEFPRSLIEKTAKIMVKNLWSHPGDKGGKNLHDKYATLEDAIKAVTEDAIKAYCI